MPFVPFSNVIQVNARYVYDGQHCENVLHFIQFGEWTPPQMLEALAVYATWEEDSGKGYRPSNVSLQELTARRLLTADDATVTHPLVVPIYGTETSPSLPNNVTLAVRLLTASTGRSGRGRIYHIGMAESHVIANNVDPVWTSNLLTNYQWLNEQLHTAGFDLAVASKVHNGAPRAEGYAQAVVAVSADPIIDSQRRRLPGRGR